MKQTALIEEHRRLGGRLIDFGGWELPVQYTGVLDEHTACRTVAGLFDVSHMGEVVVEGPGAEAFLNLLVSNNVTKVANGQAQYSVMCNEQGGIVDDLIVYRMAHDRFFVVVNASNTDKDFAWMQQVRAKYATHLADFRLENVSAEWTQIAVQGRRAQEILQELTPIDLNTIKYYWFAEGTVVGSIPAIIARTGYTGEDGFEIYVPWALGAQVWRALIEAGTPLGLKPCGLGARDTLRLEMRYPLYGHELSDTTNPLEAGLGWVTKLDKGEFVGRGPIAAIKEKGTSRSLVGIRMIDRGIPRQGYPIWSNDGVTQIGELTSGTQSPSLSLPIGLGYVAKEHAPVGTPVLVEIRGQKLKAEVVVTPFYKRPY